MIQNPDDRRPPLTPQLALRVAVIGGFALTMFAIIFFRLWFLQVLDGQQYAKAASLNTLRTVAIPAPRGEILDSAGNTLVSSTQALDVQIEPPDMPVPVTTSTMYPPLPHKDEVVYRRLARVLNVSNRPLRHGCRLAEPALAGVKPKIGHYRLAAIPCEVAQAIYVAPFEDVTVEPDVSPYVEYYLAERQNEFPGVIVQQVNQRAYPQGDLAAQLFGTIGPLTTSEVSKSGVGKGQFKGLPGQSIVGQSGLEYEYNKYLQGVDGKQRIQINADNQFQKYLRVQQPVAGENLKLWLNEKLQRVGQTALQEAIDENPPADGGAFVAMNPQNGAIYGMGSLPSFNPSFFTKPFTQAQYDQEFGTSAGSPQLNRAIDSAGPTGSTFKVITATAALESGAWGIDESYDDTGQFCFAGTSDCLHNSGHAAYGVVNLVSAIKVSDDIFFYNLGDLMNNPAPQGGALQEWARKFGIGRSTGVDLPDEATGTLPTPAWRAHENELETECENATGPFKGHPKHPAADGGCGITVTDPEESWTVGDNVNTGVGQGDVQVTPLQLAVVYSALANGGKIVTPHVGEDIQNAQGTVEQRIDPPIRRQLDINPIYLQTILQGLREAASQPGGTSADVFGNFPEQVYGKTGTAQYINDGVEQDYAWYACFVPASATSKPIVVVVTVEQGGFGAVSAAPVAREILSQWFLGKPGSYTAGAADGNQL